MLGHSKEIISADIYGGTQEIIEDCLYAIEPFIEAVMPKSGKGMNSSGLYVRKICESEGMRY